MMRPFLALLGVMALFLLLAFLFARKDGGYTPTPAEQEEIAAKAVQQKPAVQLKQFTEVQDNAVTATLEIEGKGSLKIEMYPKAAPKTVEHLTSLIKSDFYKGVLVHRVESGFVVQMGDPTSKKLKPELLRGLSSNDVSEKFQLGIAGSGKSVPLEAVLPHQEYSVGLARSQDPNSGDSQFYINLNNNNSLDGQYCVFGRVVSGQDVAAKIQIGDRIKKFSIP